ncbi:hypothetical protein DY000_02014999 [Brassica cretica]|uniref:Uncharacterized protein n=1 Tax=Brassica cretica TaxID=69181 RepID=A0ABQ7CQZ8_BRACR|nr:hypothetical protein DY000_02014999 [Brassica cretica]
MPVLLKSGQSGSQEEAVEEKKDCRSMEQYCYERKEELLQSPPGTRLVLSHVRIALGVTRAADLGLAPIRLIRNYTGLIGD